MPPRKRKTTEPADQDADAVEVAAAPASTRPRRAAATRKRAAPAPKEESDVEDLDLGDGDAPAAAAGAGSDGDESDAEPAPKRGRKAATAKTTKARAPAKGKGKGKGKKAADEDEDYEYDAAAADDNHRDDGEVDRNFVAHLIDETPVFVEDEENDARRTDPIAGQQQQGPAGANNAATASSIETEIQARKQLFERAARTWWFPFPTHPRLHAPVPAPVAVGAAAAAAAGACAADGGAATAAAGSGAADDQEEDVDFEDDSDDDEVETEANGTTGAAAVREVVDNQPDLLLHTCQVNFNHRIPVPADGLNDDHQWIKKELPIVAELSMHREPAVFYSRAHRTIDGDASTQTWGMQGDQVLVRMPENMQKETWTAQESAKLKKTEIQALVLRDPYFSEQERTNTSRWFMNDKNNHLYNLWKVEGEAPFAESDVWYDPERDQIQDLFALHNQTMSGGDNTHSITEEMMPYLRVVVRPTQLGNYKPVTPEEAALFAERGLIAKMFPYSVCIYLRTAKTNAALRKREFGVTRRIREILQMFGPTSSPMWDSTNLHDKHYARRLQAVFRNQIVMPTSEGQEMEDEHRAAEAAAAAVAAADGEDGNQGAAASSSSANSGAASGTFSLITTTRPASAGDNEHAGEEYDDFLELAVPEVHEVTAETSLVQTPAGLKLPLYDYQRRILSWLTELEMNKESREIVMPLGDGKPPYIRLGKGGMLYHVKRHEFAATDIWTPRMPPVQRLSCRGAIEASRVGSGKTISALALLQANPFRSVQDLGIARRDIGKYIPSRATLIVCRSDLTAQWQAEAVKALPGTAKVLLLTTIHDYRALTWNQVLLADAVIVSTAFLNNTNYRARVAELAGSSKFENPLPRDDDDQDEIVVSDMQQALDDYIGDLLHRGRKWFGTRKGGVVLDRIFFHRVVVDELHEFVPTEMDGLNQSERYHRRRRMHWGENRQEEVKLAPAVRKLAAETRAFLFAIRTRFLLGLTGSPVLDSPAAAERLLRLLQVRGLPANDNSQAAFMAVQSFLNKYTRRANPDLKLPPVHYQTVWMHLTPQELGLAAAAVGRDAATRLMALQHHQLLDELAGLAGNARGHEHDEVLTAAEMTRRLQADRTGKMDRLAKRITELERSLDRARADVVNKLTQFPAARRWSIQLGLTMDDLQAADGGFSQSQSQAVGATRHNAALLAIPDGDRQAIRAAVNLVIQLKRTIDTTTVELNDVTRAFNFMAAVLETVENSVEQECPICMEVIEANGELSMTACGHCYCVACSVQMRQAWNSRCAICRQPVGVMTRMKLAPSEPETVGKGHADGDDGMDVDTGDNLIDYAKYGSKVKSMVQTALRTVQRDPTAKIIMFVQFRRLASIISKAFTELGVPNASLSGGNVLTKRKAVTSFKKDPNIKVLFLSYQDSVSGLHLVEANHVFICHPFLAEDEATSRAYETQGIARAVRAGQLREVTIVRFASRGTIEEELTNQRTMREEERPEVVVEEP